MFGVITPGAHETLRYTGVLDPTERGEELGKILPIVDL